MTANRQRFSNVEQPDRVLVGGVLTVPAPLLLSEPCGHCGAGPGRRCMGSAGRLRPSASHLSRVRAALSAAEIRRAMLTAAEAGEP